MAANANGNSSTGTVVSNHAKPISSPWTQIVRGESELIAAGSSLPSPSSPSTAVIAQAASASAVEEEGVENGSGTNGNAGKKAAWNRPSNGAAEAGSVMGAQWPALSESARVSSKPPSDSPKVLSDGSSSSSSSSVVSQGTGNASFSSQKLVSNNANSNSTPNHTVPVRQRSMKRGGASSNGSLSQPPPPPGSVVEAPLNSPSRDHAQRSGFISQSHSGNDHPQHRNSFRNRNGGPHPRGDGSHTQNYGRRRNQDHVNQDWNNHRNFNGRDAHLQPRGVPRFIRHAPPPPPPLPNTAQYMAHPPSRPFGAPMGFPEFSPTFYYVPVQAHPDSLRGVSFIAPMQPVFFPPPDLQLHANIVNQIDYYFSNENLIKDTFLRQHMDDQGWVPIKLIAGFKKVLHLTDNIQLILDAVRSSTVVEVQGDKIRKRNDWKRWIMLPSAVQFSNISSPRSGENSSPDMLTASIQNISLDQNATNQGGSMNQENVHAESLAGRSSSGDLNSLLLSSSEGMAVNAQGGPVRISS